MTLADMERALAVLMAKVRSIEDGNIPSDTLRVGTGRGRAVALQFRARNPADLDAEFPGVLFDPARGPDVLLVGSGGSPAITAQEIGAAAVAVALDADADAADTSAIAWSELLRGDTDGTNRIFYAEHILTGGKGLIAADGIVQRPAQYDVAARRIVLDFAPSKGVVATYPYDTDVVEVSYRAVTMARRTRKVAAKPRAKRRAERGLPWLGIRGR